MDFAERWANKMEQRLNKGLALKDIASKCVSVANTKGISGFMYGCAIQSLSWFWEHGEELRVWHNLDTQMSTEGEAANASGRVLNPTLLRMSIEGQE